jgi:predicted ArsR family transcriptional regulator
MVIGVGMIDQVFFNDLKTTIEKGGIFKMCEHIRRQIMSYIEQVKIVSRGRLADVLNIPRSTIYDNLVILEREGRLQKKELPRTKVGRPKSLWYLPKPKESI